VQAIEGREAALQQVEEARLALRAADRDNAEAGPPAAGLYVD